MLAMNNQDDQQLDLDDRLCPGCKRSAVTEQGGLVVAFGQSFFHVDCFKCAKCGDQVTADTNLLLLSDGSPICANCSYSCNVCHNPILDEAIMTGDDSYHAHCFKCKVCKNRIDELVFAKTSQGIYCMKCHNERMIKIRKHTQKKAERERAAAGAQGSTSSRDRDARQQRPQPSPGLGPNDMPPGSSASATTPMTPRSHGADGVRSPPRQRSGQYISDAFEASDPRQQNASVAAPVPPPQPSPSFRVAPPERDTLQTPVFQPPSDARSNPHKQTTLPLPPSAPSDDRFDSRRKSFDDGVRPLNALFPQGEPAPAPAPAPAPSGLTVATSRQDRRRSINPGLTLNNLASTATNNVASASGSPSPPSPSLSPLSATFRSSSRPATPNERTPSPRQESYPGSNSRPNSASSNTHFSSSSSPRTPPSDKDLSQDQTVVMSPSSRPNVILDSVPLPRKQHTQTASRDRLSATLEGRRSYDERPPSQNGRHSSDMVRPSSRSRSDTPSSLSRRADVPHNVESGTDTEAEGESHSDSPPPPPPKETKSATQSPPNRLAPLGDDADASMQLDSSDDMSESSPVEHTSHSTFIAPALPPIRFSMTTADFSDLFNSAEGQKASRRHLANISEDINGNVPMTPPPTASSVFSSESSLMTPTTDSTFTADSLSTSTRTSEDGGNAPATRYVSPAPRFQSLGKKPLSAVNGSDHVTTESARARSSSESQPQQPARVTITRAESANAVPTLNNDQASMVMLRLQEALADAQSRGAQQLKLDRGFIEAILGAMESRDSEYTSLKSKFDGVKRASKQYIDGLTVAQTEYDSELKARRDAEAEVTRLRVLLSGQAARLTTLSGDTRRQELREQMSKELNENMSGLEHDLSKLRVERDMALAEVEELSATKRSAVEVPPANLGRSLTTRLDTIKKQYQRDLIPLREERENLVREVAELKGVRDVFLEETTVLNARNEELAQLSAQYARRMVPIPETPQKNQQQQQHATPMRGQHSAQQSQHLNMLTPSASGSSSASDDTHDSRLRMDAPTPSKGKFIKWPGSRTKEPAPAPTPAQQAPLPPPPAASTPEPRQKPTVAHNFQQLSVLRFTRCDHCADKMWGSQLRCTTCSISVHVRCVNHVQVSCQQHSGSAQEEELPPSMFGRDLTEQVQADARGGDRQIPVIVEKCIDAVETLALEYEGIYRKSGGSGQSKAITQLFERGDYAAFDLCDSDRFNDICSVTSVLKTYFRSLPVPLLTFDLHDHFMSAVQIRDPSTKNQTLLDLVNKLPAEHYYTLRRLMVHLNHVHERCEKNLMTARNLGVVFGPTLMRSRDPGAEFSDMAGKALSIEWFVENAQNIWPES
ncbi:RhoGAP-domain-containing protein [Mycena alexandri]|uniref:RhoGAP-domain-containing protein n=1 Tax=Mycena alexandri TaxID=1745969 RepID=A0AAD6TJJ9_9AGAR|nr:RhoGAP-domain-containing protein [Mycena alexandri]